MIVGQVLDYMSCNPRLGDCMELDFQTQNGNRTKACFSTQKMSPIHDWLRQSAIDVTVIGFLPERISKIVPYMGLTYLKDERTLFLTGNSLNFVIVETINRLLCFTWQQ